MFIIFLRKFEDKEEMICESIGTPGIRSPE